MGPSALASRPSGGRWPVAGVSGHCAALRPTATSCSHERMRHAWLRAERWGNPCHRRVPTTQRSRQTHAHARAHRHTHARPLASAHDSATAAYPPPDACAHTLCTCAHTHLAACVGGCSAHLRRVRGRGRRARRRVPRRRLSARRGRGRRRRAVPAGRGRPRGEELRRRRGGRRSADEALRRQQRRRSGPGNRQQTTCDVQRAREQVRHANERDSTRRRKRCSLSAASAPAGRARRCSGDRPPEFASRARMRSAARLGLYPSVHRDAKAAMQCPCVRYRSFVREYARGKSARTSRGQQGGQAGQGNQGNRTTVRACWG